MSESDGFVYPPTPSVHLETERTIVRLAIEEDVEAIVRYYTENREHLRPFDPERPPYFYLESFWRRQVKQNEDDYALDRSLRLFIYAGSEPNRVIGNIGFSNFVRGVGHYCTLGYSLDVDFQGKGLMSEALKATIDFAFRTLQMHRIEANYLPHNRRSGNVLRRLGFVVEGYSRDYLRINGRWEDHVRTALLHPEAV
ncbi:MAG: GNAT family N-acetyltransferase [Gemmatimonas sp.]|nr:GNAT family N-acetyltransferase [Gemmatimonas sp.]